MCFRRIASLSDDKSDNIAIHRCSLCQYESKNGTNDEPKSAEAKALAKYPYEVFKEIILTNDPSATVNFGTKIRAFNTWFAANEKKLEAEEVSEVFKDYRTFVNDAAVR